MNGQVSINLLYGGCCMFCSVRAALLLVLHGRLLLMQFQIEQMQLCLRLHEQSKYILLRS